MYCSQWGKRIRKDSKFCFSCGAEVSLEPGDKVGELVEETLDLISDLFPENDPKEG